MSDQEGKYDDNSRGKGPLTLELNELLNQYYCKPWKVVSISHWTGLSWQPDFGFFGFFRGIRY